MDERARDHWSVDRRVNLAHIVATLALAGTLAAYLMRQEARVVILEEHRIGQLARDARQDSDLKETRSEVALLFREVRDELRGLRNELAEARRQQGGAR
jgi:hypothetical protein